MMPYSFTTATERPERVGGYDRETQVIAAAKRYLRRTGEYSARIWRDDALVGVLRNDGFGNRRSFSMDYSTKGMR